MFHITELVQVIVNYKTIIIFFLPSVPYDPEGFYYYYYYCRHEAYRLVADIVMMLEDILMYIPLKTGLIWIKVGR